MIALDIEGLLRNRSAAVSGALWRVGATGVQEGYLAGTAPRFQQPWDPEPLDPEPDRIVVTAWFDAPDRGAILSTLHRWLDADTRVVWRQEPEVDWVATTQSRFQRVELGPITIAPPWDAQEGDLVIEPGAGFGTGEHQTTRQLLRFFGSGLPGRTALDIGSGSGILALAAARTGMQVHGTEVEPEAIRNATHNAALNGLQVRFDDQQPDALDMADLVFANLHAELLVRFAHDLVRVTGRDLLLAGILADKESAVRAAISLPLHDRNQDGEWVALHYRRST